MSFQKILIEQRRLAILDILADSGACNSRLLTDMLRALGVGGDHDQVIDALRWLEAARLVVLRQNGDFTVATITNEGVQVKDGGIIKAGVALPGVD